MNDVNFRTACVVFVWVAAVFSGWPNTLQAADDSPGDSNKVPVRMQPFKVAAEWMEIQPLIVGGVIDYVRVVHVQKASPAAAAGVREGMHIVELQGIRVSGLTEREFGSQMDALPPAERLTLKVRGTVQTTELVVSFPHPSDTNSPLEAGSKSAEPTVRTVPAIMTEAEAKKRLAEIRRALERERARVVADARKAGSARMDSFVLSDAAREAGIVAASHLAVVCEEVVNTEGNNAALPFRGALTIALRQPRDYLPEQKTTVLKYLPRIPYLIQIVDRMQWFDGSEPAIAAGWKKARGDLRDGMLTPDSSKYAIIAARQGLKEALVAICQTVRQPKAGSRSKGLLLQEESAALAALVPQLGDALAAKAEFVQKNITRLEFDRTQKIYTLTPTK